MGKKKIIIKMLEPMPDHMKQSTITIVDRKEYGLMMKTITKILTERRLNRNEK